jgi:hypothetical protein
VTQDEARKVQRALELVGLPGEAGQAATSGLGSGCTSGRQRAS